MHKEREFILSFISLQNDVYNLLDIGEYKRICINGEETKYLINSLGFIINTNYKNKGKIQVKKSYADSRGYQKLTIHHKKDYSIRVHRLVAEAFIANPENKPEVNHKNGVKSDNSVFNLEWVTGLENMQHAVKTDLIRRNKKCYNFKYSDAITHEICRLLEENKLYMHQIANKLGVTYSFVVAVKTKKDRTYISNMYDLSKYTLKEPKMNANYFNRNHFSTYDESTLKYICEKLEEGMIVKDISEITGINMSSIFRIKQRKVKNKKFNNIIKNYNF